MSFHVSSKETKFELMYSAELTGVSDTCGFIDERSQAR